MRDHGHAVGDRALWVIDWISRILATIAGAILILIMAAVCFDSLLRNFTGRGFPAAVEYSEILLVVLVYLGWSQAQQMGRNVSVDLLTARMPANVQRMIAIAGLLLVIVTLAFITWRTGVVAWQSYLDGEFRIGITHTVLWPARGALTLGLFAMVLQCLAQTYRLIRGDSLNLVLNPSSSLD